MSHPMLEIIPFVLGPVETNTYLVADPATNEAVIIDPAWDGQKLAKEVRRRNWRITQVWITHAHFDHMAGTAGLLKALEPAPSVALHPLDLPLWQLQGGAAMFGMSIDTGPLPDVQLSHGQVLHLGTRIFEVRHTPGHSPGHVIFYCSMEQLVFCGDLVFAGSIGRADLPGGNYSTLMNSIRTDILPLDDHNRLLSGHGPETTVGVEKKENPFLNGSVW
jgi:hydroxyacylglutathione hydrolase